MAPRTKPGERYAAGKAVRRAINAIILEVADRIDEDWTLEKMARRAGYESHHFAHAFSETIEVPPVEYVRSLRLERAAHDLMYARDKSLGQIAEEARYGSPEAFRRAFRRAFERSPTELRRNLAPSPRGRRPRLAVDVAPDGDWLAGGPSIVSLDRLSTISLRAERFDDAAIEAAWRSFWPHAWPSEPWTIGGATPPWGFVTESRNRQYRCFRIVGDARPSVDDPLEAWTVADRWYVRFVFRGAMARMHDLFRWVFSRWLPESGLRYAFAPVLTLFDPTVWLATGFVDAHARVHVPVSPLRG